jgi:tetratricopeptide (TPR) repeat protein
MEQVLKNIGNTYYALHNYPQAIAYYERCARITRSIKDISSAAQMLNNLGNACCATGNYGKAILYFEERLQLAKEMKNTQI